MRVIAGKYRSRPLVAPRGLTTRPTSDRLRETLFNVLAPRIEGAFFADLYAGSGAVGIEALSRGATSVWFVESAAPAVASLRANLASLGIRSGIRIESGSVAAALRGFAAQRSPRPWDIVFLDPPYAAAGAYVKTLLALGAGTEPLLAPGGLAIAEHRRARLRAAPTLLAESYGELRRIRVIEQGDASLSLYQMSGERREIESPRPAPAIVPAEQPLNPVAAEGAPRQDSGEGDEG